MPQRKNYLIFLQRFHPVNEDFCSENRIDERCIKLLEVIALNFEASKPLITTKVMQLSKFGSPAINYRSLRVLKEAGLVEIFYEGMDRRAKYVRATSKADAYFSDIGNEMINSSEKDIEQ